MNNEYLSVIKVAAGQSTQLVPVRVVPEADDARPGGGPFPGVAPSQS